MPRAGTLLGSLRTLFKASRNGSQRTEDAFSAGVADATLVTGSAFSTDPAAPFCDLYARQSRSPVASSKEEAKTTSVPDAVPKAFHRKLFSRSFLPARSTLSVTETAICHSISDPFDNPGKHKDTAACLHDGDVHASKSERARRLPAKTSRLIAAARDADSPVLASAETTPVAACNSRRCVSLDIPATGLSSSAASGKSRLRQPVVLSTADNSVHLRSPEQQSSSLLMCSIDAPQFDSPLPSAPPPPPTATPPPACAAANTTLLALCPGIPAAMRRRLWCVEDYDVSRKIYKGATSTVYKATCRHSGLPVALKVYFLSKVPTNVIHMIVREIKIHVELVHKHIVMLYAAFQDEKRLVLVQEYAGRGDLYGIHRSLNRRMTEAQLTHLVLAPFMEALTYLHARGICHRDIKPENILFTNDWRLLIADFGVSIDLNQERAVTRAGTLEYMAPEVERCPLKMLPEENKDNPQLAYTTAVDIWAVGVLAYELMVGFPPFVGGDRAPPLDARGAGWSWIAAARQALSFPLSASEAGRDFISSALAERPEERPTARQLLQHPWLLGAVQQLYPREA